MDNAKTGAFIQQLRREREMTQKDLARQLHVTDRAVSKWERGLCAPDIALLEPLAAALEISVLELLAGERTGPGEAEAEERVRQVIGYSAEEIRRKVKALGTRRILAAAACVALAAASALFLLWQRGVFCTLDRVPAPDGQTEAVVYSRALSGSGFSLEDAVSLIVTRSDGARWRVIYGGCAYEGLWWAPDGRKYVLALETAEGNRLALAWLDRNSESNLSAYLTMGVEATELAKYGYVLDGGWPEIDYQFLQWAEDSASMLIYYAFADRSGQPHSGYFWYDCLSGTVEAVLEMDAPAG